MKHYKQIALTEKTYKRLKHAGAKGETYDQIVSRLLDIWIEKFSENLTKLERS